MKLKEKIIIDFKEFLSTGKFDFLKHGKTKEWVINNFPDPDGFDDSPEIYKDNIWCYGNIELHFHKEELFLIFSDYINTLDGGPSLELKKWFLGNKETPTLLEAISELNKAHLDFEKVTRDTGEIIEIKLKSGVKLSFLLEEKEDETSSEYRKRCDFETHDNFILCAFSWIRK